jgi:hypothetical protein
MNLQHLAKPQSSKKYAKIFESQFGAKLKLNLNLKQATRYLNETKKIIAEYRQSTKFHSSQQDSTYMQGLMLEQALTQKVKELSEADAGSFGGNNTNTGKTMKPIVPGKMSGEYANALKKTAMGEDISVKEWKKLKKRGISENLLVVLESKKTSIKLMRKIVESKRTLTEDEVSQAQVVLAAQDMVDRVQKMVEDMIDLQYKDVPALADTMKGELGTDQAMQFKDAMGAALSTLAETLNTTKEQMDAAVAIVTGEEIASPMGDLEGVDMDADMDMDIPMDDMDMAPEAVPVPDAMDSDLGREKR